MAYIKILQHQMYPIKSERTEYFDIFLINNIYCSIFFKIVGVSILSVVKHTFLSVLTLNDM